MNQKFEILQKIIEQFTNLSDEEKNSAFSALKEANRELEITAFKLDRTEKVKRTTSILLEETFVELELKRKVVEEQNRELEIEAALERVRTVAMGMNKPDDLLSICAILFTELTSLGFEKLRNTLISTFEDRKEYFIDYDYSDAIGGNITKIPYQSHPALERFQKQIMSAADAFAELIIGEDQLNDWKEYRRSNGEPDDPRLENISALYYYFYSIGTAAIGISAFSSISEDKRQVLKRFRNVFEFAYKRYTDVERAEEQAREAQIELGLERVRARAMAMQNSDELKELIGTVFTELTKLDLALTRCVIWVFEPSTNAARWWMANSEEPSNPMSFYIKYHEHPAYLTFVKEWKNQNVKFVYDLNGADKIAWDDILFNETELKELPDVVKDGMKSPERVLLSASFNNFGGINVASLEPLSDEHFDILLRFAKVFDLTYTRFNDLQQAEAQTREAQIEAALERVRSRTMAMQNSNELAETAAVLFKQLMILGVEPNRIYIAIIKDENGTCEFWITDEDGSKVSSGFTTNLNDNLTFLKMFEGWKEHKKSITIDMHGKELEEYFKQLNQLNVPFKGGLSQKRRVQNIAYFSKGFIGIASPEPQPEETINLLERFAGVFNLTFTRFLDLKNAETQNIIIQAENERKTKELEDARNLQFAMLPRELPKLPNLEIAVYMKTATEVGGDYYDYHVHPDGTLTVILGDATGHGMMSGMMVSVMKSLFIAHKSNIELKQFFENANNSIKDMQLGRLMMTLLGVQITSNKIIATNAGMPSLIYFRNKSQKAGEFVSNNLPLGAMRRNKYSLKEIEYERGDTLLLMTDGLAELRNGNDEQYGYARVKNEFRSVANKKADDIIDYLKNSASCWVNGTEPEDDITFVVIKLK